MFDGIKRWWQGFETKHETGAQFILFFIFSNGVTILQLALMPIFRAWFDKTNLIDMSFQHFPIGHATEAASQYYIFNYPAGPIQPDGVGGGLAYFLAVQITLLIAQIVNFFLQRNVTFKSNTSPWYAAMWYFIAYVIITFAAGALQGFYKAPIYSFFMETLGWGSSGETVADVITMIINSALSFWVFFPIFKVIFRRVPEEEEAAIKEKVDQDIARGQEAVAAREAATAVTEGEMEAQDGLDGGGANPSRRE